MQIVKTFKNIKRRKSFQNIEIKTASKTPYITVNVNRLVKHSFVILFHNITVLDNPELCNRIHI